MDQGLPPHTCLQGDTVFTVNNKQYTYLLGVGGRGAAPTHMPTGGYSINSKQQTVHRSIRTHQGGCDAMRVEGWEGAQRELPPDWTMMSALLVLS